MLHSSTTLKPRDYISRKTKIWEKYKEPLSAFRSRRIEEFARHKGKLAKQKQTEIKLKKIISKNTIREAMKACNKKCEESRKKKEKAEKYLKRVEDWENFVIENNGKINEAESIFKRLLLNILENEKSIFDWLRIQINNEVYWQLFSQIETAKTIRDNITIEIKTRAEKLVPEYLRYLEKFIKKGMNEIIAEKEAQKTIEAKKREANDDIKQAKIIFNKFNSAIKTKQAEVKTFLALANLFWAKKKENIEEAEQKMLKTLESFPHCSCLSKCNN